MPPPASSSYKRPRLNPRKRSRDRVDEDHTSSSVHAQILFTALRNVIVPLVQAALPTKKDLREVPFGREAEELLVALQNYVTSIVSDQSDKKTGDSTTALVKSSHKSMAPSESPSCEKGSTVVVRSIGASSNLKLTKALTLLRQHVFDTMPIRLLRFGRYQTKFEIILVEREQIYTELAGQLEAVFEKKAEPGDMNAMVFKIAQYSILSHTWLRGAAREITYDDWLKGDYDTKQPGYRKLYNFCKTAARHGFTYGWMDTVCINKSSSAELDESIRSMYKWYSKATICITYLAATTTLSTMDQDPWFTRGWTLQELIAPKFLKFYDMDWNKLVNDRFNDKANSIILQKIESATMISCQDMAALSSVPISRKMRWAARREVTRGEDAAYSLIGIFNVNISISYGEGSEQAFLRLLKEILNTTKDNILDIFNWAGEYEIKGLPLLPSSPKAYLHSYPTDQLQFRCPIEPLTLTHLGLRIPVLLLSAIPTTTPDRPFDCIGDFYATVDIETPMPEIPRCYNLLDRKVQSWDPHVDGDTTVVFAVLNCLSDECVRSIPPVCLAVAIVVNADYSRRYNAGSIEKRIPTKKPIVFELFHSAVIPDYSYDTLFQRNSYRYMG